MNESSDSGPSSPPLPFGLGAGCPAADAGIVFLENPNRYPGVDAASLRPWLEQVVAELAPAAGSFAVRFCGDRAMRRANRDYRGLDKTTDVLSFPGDLPPLPATTLGQRKPGQKSKAKAEPAAPDLPPGFVLPPGDHLGDVLISVPQASRQAAELGHPLALELRVLLLHGILHCLGYDHEVDDGTMNRVEAGYRRRFVGEIGFIEGSES